MKSVNRWTGIGNVGKDPEVKFLPNGTPVATLSLACNERFKGKDGEWTDRTEWINLKAWQRTAEIIGEYVKKGSKIYIEGRINTESWDDRTTGKKQYKTVVVVSELVLLDGRGGGEEERSARAPRHMSDEEVARGTEITDEDIPF